jgi:AraC-like DNA-binding protein
MWMQSGAAMTNDHRMSQFVGQYQEWRPAEALRPHVHCVWLNDLSRSSACGYCVVPDGCVDIIWTGESLCLAGPDTKPIPEKVRLPGPILGVRFRPGAAVSWVGVPMSEMLNVRVPLEEFWEQDARELQDRILGASSPLAALGEMQRALEGRLREIGPADGQIAFLRACASRTDSERRPIGLLSQEMGVCERTLRRQCNDAFGYGFKTLERILRFQRLFQFAVRRGCSNLADLAAETGFADQAHMSRELHRLSDLTPAEFIAQASGGDGRFVQDAPADPS